ncbi:MAG: hypothetical protein KDA89_07945 [Planctomycetaceae bacterium]|nr:hypothetical protein [Planctomycetaceae bacterium]
MDLAGVDVLLSGSYVPVVGDEFIVVSVGSVTNKLDGPDEGDVLPFNGVPIKIHYTSTAMFLKCGTLVVSSTSVRVNERGTNTFTVKLAAQPLSVGDCN